MATITNADRIWNGPENNATIAYQRPFDDNHIIITASIIFFFLIVGLIGNGLTILVIASYKSLSSNVFMRFILSLCVSDLISALISWLFLYRRTWGFDRWSPIPDVFCSFYWAADLMTSYVTSLHIFCFAVLRLISIKTPHFFLKIQIKHSHIWIGIIWIICGAFGFIPATTIFGTGMPDRHSSHPNARWPACTTLMSKMEEYYYFQNITIPIFLYAPIIGVVTVCLYIIILVKNRSKSMKQKKQRNKERHAVIQLALIIFAFFLGYLPFTAYEFWSVQSHPQEQYYYNFDYWFGMTEYLFLRFSECLNPIFYNLGSAKMRKYTKKFLKEKVFCCFNWEKVEMNKRRKSSLSPTTYTQEEI